MTQGKMHSIWPQIGVYQAVFKENETFKQTSQWYRENGNYNYSFEVKLNSVERFSPACKDNLNLCSSSRDLKQRDNKKAVGMTHLGGTQVFYHRYLVTWREEERSEEGNV